jgi:hypothetical protein
MPQQNALIDPKQKLPVGSNDLPKVYCRIDCCSGLGSKGEATGTKLVQPPVYDDSDIGRASGSCRRWFDICSSSALREMRGQ